MSSIAVYNYGAVGCNCITFIFLIAAIAAPIWTGGIALYNQGDLTAGVSFGPQVAGKLYDNIPVPCGCDENGFCFALCSPSLATVNWLDITPELACGLESQVYQAWSGPLGYCQFPTNFTVPPLPEAPTVLPANSTGWIGLSTPPPEGTRFLKPAECTQVQAMMIVSTILMGVVCVMSLINNPFAQAIISFFCFTSFALTVASLSVWTTFSYVQLVTLGVVGVPVFVDPTQLYVMQTRNMVYGASWGLTIAACILCFLAGMYHATFARSMGNLKEEPATKQEGAASSSPPPPAQAPATEAKQDATLAKA